MKIRNVSPLGDLTIPALGRDVAAGEVVDAPDEIAVDLITQGIFEAVKSTGKGE